MLALGLSSPRVSERQRVPCVCASVMRPAAAILLAARAAQLLLLSL